MKRLRVLIVEDSATVREFLRYVIGRDPRLEVAAAVETGEEAIRILSKVNPDVISLDIHLPGMNGFETTRRIMSDQPTPIVVVSASAGLAMDLTMKSLQAGALTVVEKPKGDSRNDYENLADKLCTQLAVMSQVHVVRQRRHARNGVHPRTRPARSRPGTYRMLGIASSTGGPDALGKLFRAMDENFPLPILLVQHITPSFLPGFASWLSKICPFKVQIIEERIHPVAGTIYLAAVDRHLVVDEQSVFVNREEPVCAQRPSGTILFRSMAESLGEHALGVLLTGMGEDGAQGLLELRNAGGYTVAEDQSTAIVYGMPRAAMNHGAACESLPLPAIARRITELAGVGREARQ
jgi:two-component system chemotaxis response regulator CheB